MKAAFSVGSGTLVVSNRQSETNVVIDVKARSVMNQVPRWLHLSTDWEEYQDDSVEKLVESCNREYWIQRASDLLLIISRYDDCKEVLDEINDIVMTYASAEEVMNRLLIAPLLDRSYFERLAITALADGYSAVASILDQVVELQPNLLRLVDNWLSIVSAHEDDLEIADYQTIWRLVNRRSNVSKLIRSTTEKEFLNNWNKPIFDVHSNQVRLKFGSVANKMASRMTFVARTTDADDSYDSVVENVDELYSDEHYRRNFGDSHAENIRVTKQISAIVEAVSEGKDAKASKYLEELVQQQVSANVNSIFVVKSLCNIAQKCSYIFRYDFEQNCLLKANSLLPTDQWTLVQLGNFYKRMGKHEDAIKYLTQASELGIQGRDIVNSSIADVMKEQGRYEEALQLYDSIETNTEFQNKWVAIADLKRLMGKREEAKALYHKAIESAKTRAVIADELRARAGLAELEKREGNLKEARSTYEDILDNYSHSETDYYHYTVAQVDVCKRMGDYNRALQLLDEVIRKFPFSVQASRLRAVLFGLVGKTNQAMSQLLKESSEGIFQQWSVKYFHGLLLLKLNRYSDARSCLIENYIESTTNSNRMVQIRLGAALWYLTNSDGESATNELQKVQTSLDDQTDYLRFILEFHAAVIVDDRLRINEIMQECNGFKSANTSIKTAVQYIISKQFEAAIVIEIDEMLRVAA